MNPPTLRGIAFLAIIAAASPAAHAAGPDSIPPEKTAQSESSPLPSLPLARALIAGGRWEEGLGMLELLRERPSIDPTEVRFLSALAEIGLGRFSAAVELLRTILDARPGLLRVRLELARALFLDGDDDAARHHFEYVLAAEPPPAVAANVRLFLNRIRARRGWQLWTNFGLAPDSNINTAPDGDTICIGDLCGFVLSSDARAKSGTGVFVSVGGEWRKNLANHRQFVWDFAAHHRDYPGNIADDQTLRTSPGLRFLRDGGATKLSLVADRRWLNGDPYSHGFGVRVDNEHPPTPRLRLEESVETVRRRHDESGDARDNDTHSAALRASFALSPVSVARAHLETARVRAETPLNSNSSRALFLQYRRDFPAAITAGLGVRWSRTRYDGITPLGGVRRRDSYRAFTLTLLKRDWRLFGFVPALSVTRARNNSNLEINTYRRTVGGLNFTREF